MSGQDINPFAESNAKQPAPTPAPPPPQQGGPLDHSEDPFAQAAPPPPPGPPPPQTGGPVFYDGPAGGATGGSAESVPYNPQYGAPGQTPPPAAAQQQYGGYAQPQQQQQQGRYEGSQQPQDPNQQPQQGGDDIAQARELKSSKFWRMEFYQQFFDVDTNDVMRRITNSFVPMAPPDFLMSRNWHANSQQTGVPVETGAEGSNMERTPDLYGPFWLCTTLWMIIAIVGNIMSKISHSHAIANKVPGTPKDWSYDFKVASVASIVIYVYWLLMSLFVLGVSKWKKLPITLLDCLGLYGYSMTLWVLAAILCVAPIPGFQWIVCLAAGIWSSTYLIMNMWHVWKSRLEKTWFIFMVCFVFIMHMGITMSFKFYFLNYDL